MSQATSSDFVGTATWIREQELSRSAWIDTPFGRRVICYADLTATGRHLPSVEAWIDRVRPFYANTHTEISTTGRTMTVLRERARTLVRNAVHAAEDDEVLFCGAGATAAVNKLVGLLGLRISEPLEREYGWSRTIPADRRPVVVVGPYEHHSNELPWVESVAEVVEVGLDREGRIDRAALGERLERLRDRPLVIGSFSAASNVTGLLTDVPAIASVLHRAGALAFFDYAAAGPYVPIDMHPQDPDASLDAIFLSPHKFIGGPEASGLLVAARKLFRSRTPERPGGGTVDYVAGARREDIDYTRDLTVREEGGTPSILGDLRVGLAFTIKEMAGADAILAHEIGLARRAAERLSLHPRIRVLGPDDAERLAIVPIEIEGLHHELASTLLDHLFGIQNRAGCSCAGPYGHRLLGIAPEDSDRFRGIVQRGVSGIKPGWVRLSLPWYGTDDDLDFLLAAVEFVADHGLEFVPLYRFDWRSGAWRHMKSDQQLSVPIEISASALLDRNLEPLHRPLTEDALREERRRYVREAERLAAKLRHDREQAPPRWNPPTGDAELDALTWFRYVHAVNGPAPS